MMLSSVYLTSGQNDLVFDKSLCVQNRRANSVPHAVLSRSDATKQNCDAYAGYTRNALHCVPDVVFISQLV